MDSSLVIGVVYVICAILFVAFLCRNDGKTLKNDEGAVDAEV